MEKQHPYMSLYGYILVLYYAHYAINVDENTFYFNFTTTFSSYIVITFFFSYHYTFTTSCLNQKTLFFLLIIKLISPLRLLCQDLGKLHNFISLLISLLRSNVMIKRKIIYLVTTFITPRPQCKKKFFFSFIQSLRSLRHD